MEVSEDLPTRDVWRSLSCIPGALSVLIMSDNPSFVLRGIEDVVYEDRPIPDSASITYEIATVAVLTRRLFSAFSRRH